MTAAPAAERAGPLVGLRVIELGAIGPAPFAGMMLADLGADVVRIDRLESQRYGAFAHRVLDRGRRSVAVDLKNPRGAQLVLDLVAGADALVEGFRPGVAERLGLGPDAALQRNPRLVYGRMTGWGQHGPESARAGHDINYLALTGALEPIVGPDGDPVAPLNMLGDFGGGGLLLAFGVMTALWQTQRTGVGEVVDAAIVDGVALFTSMLHSMRAAGQWGTRGGNMFDGGAPYYGVYRTADDRWMAVGAVEPNFYAQLLKGLELDLGARTQNDVSTWPAVKDRISQRFRTRTRDEWAAVFADTDACVTPVLSPPEATTNAHLAARQVFTEHDGVIHPAPAPRFSRSPGAWTRPAPAVGQHTREVLLEVMSAPEIDDLVRGGVVGAD